MRERLTELGLDFVARQVPADENQRDELGTETGNSEIPVLVFESGETIAGDDDILAGARAALLQRRREPVSTEHARPKTRNR